MNAAALGLPLLVGLVAIALLFDFLNGLHDAANSIATIVSTRVLRPQYAVFWAAFFNFIAFLFFGLHVATTIGTGIITASVVDPQVVFGARMGGDRMGRPRQDGCRDRAVAGARFRAGAPAGADRVVGVRAHHTLYGRRV